MADFWAVADSSLYRRYVMNGGVKVKGGVSKKFAITVL